MSGAIHKDGSGNVLGQYSYQYDVFGNLVEQDNTVGGQTTVSKYAYDPSGNAWADLNSSKQLQMRRLYASINGQVQAYGRIDGSGNAAWYGTDKLGSVRLLTSGSGAVLDQVSYDSWGNVSSESSQSSGDRIKWAQGEYHSELGLYRFGAREYNPSSGRWQQQDPSGFSAGDANLYRYVGNSPVNAIDPSGLQAQPSQYAAPACPVKKREPLAEGITLQQGATTDSRTSQSGGTEQPSGQASAGGSDVSGNGGIGYVLGSLLGGLAGQEGSTGNSLSGGGSAPGWTPTLGGEGLGPWQSNSSTVGGWGGSTVPVAGFGPFLGGLMPWNGNGLAGAGGRDGLDVFSPVGAGGNGQPANGPAGGAVGQGGNGALPGGGAMWHVGNPPPPQMIEKKLDAGGFEPAASPPQMIEKKLERQGESPAQALPAAREQVNTASQEGEGGASPAGQPAQEEGTLDTLKRWGALALVVTGQNHLEVAGLLRPQVHHLQDFVKGQIQAVEPDRGPTGPAPRQANVPGQIGGALESLKRWGNNPFGIHQLNLMGLNIVLDLVDGGLAQYEQEGVALTQLGRGQREEAKNSSWAYAGGVLEKLTPTSLALTVERWEMRYRAYQMEQATGRKISDQEFEQVLRGGGDPLLRSQLAEYSGLPLRPESLTGLVDNLHEASNQADAASAERGRKAGPTLEAVATFFLTDVLPQAAESLLTREASTALQLERQAGKGANPAQDLAESALKQCFPAGTLVDTLEGLRPIESVKPGEEVWSYDVIGSEWRACQVLQTFQQSYDGHSVFVTVGGETIESTYLHPYWVLAGEGLAERPRRSHLPSVPEGATTAGRWVDAADLQAGDQLLLHDGRRAAIEAVQVAPYTAEVYNFEVAQLHCYAVGKSKVLVHNDNGSELLQAAEQAAKDQEILERLFQFGEKANHGPEVEAALARRGLLHEAAPRTGTVWDRIRPTQEVWPGTEIPRSFELTTQNGQRVWVHGNATEHLAERVVGANGPRMRLELARNEFPGTNG